MSDASASTASAGNAAGPLRTNPTPVRGSCLCGGVRYEVAAGALAFALHCHCSMCRKAHGTAFRSRARCNADGFRFTRGEHLVRYWESSPGQHRGFCSVCGSSLLTRFDARAEGFRPDRYGLALGTLDDDPGIRPLLHCWVGSKAPWFEITDGLPQYEEEPRPGPAAPPVDG